MIKKNLILTVTELTKTGEEEVLKIKTNNLPDEGQSEQYKLKTLADRTKFVLEVAGGVTVINDVAELLKAIELVKAFGDGNPSEAAPVSIGSVDAPLQFEYGPVKD